MSPGGGRGVAVVAGMGRRLGRPVHLVLKVTVRASQAGAHRGGSLQTSNLRRVLNVFGPRSALVLGK